MEDVGTRVEELLSLSSETSAKVQSSWLTVLKRLAMSQNLSKTLKQKIFSISSQVLHSSPHPVVHSKAEFLWNFLNVKLHLSQPQT